jgi:GT2 family glycosyltransferase
VELPSPAVTVVVVPRERFSRALESLERLYEVTDTPFDLVYVDGRSPRKVRDHLRAASEEHGFTLLREERYLAPNRARNLALPHVHTPYVVFMDNDLLVTPGWLDALVDCAEETGAWAVGPLYFEGDPGDELIHMAGGSIEFSGEAGRRTIRTTHHHQHVRLADAPALGRGACDYLEFHCALVRTDVFGRIGALDEGLLSSREHLDLCLRITEAGGTVWFEPASQVTYLSPPPVPLGDIPYYWLRWSDAWSRASLEHFSETYGIDGNYVDRVGIMRGRRQLVFAPVQAWTGRRLGGKAERVLGRALSAAEPRLNRLFVWSIAGRRAAAGGDARRVVAGRARPGRP